MSEVEYQQKKGKGCKSQRYQSNSFTISDKVDPENEDTSNKDKDLFNDHLSLRSNQELVSELFSVLQTLFIGRSKSGQEITNFEIFVSTLHMKLLTVNLIDGYCNSIKMVLQ